MTLKNAVLDDDELKVGLQSLNAKYGDFVLRVAGEAWALPLIDQKTKALIAMTTDVVNQSISSPNNPFAYHVNMAMKLGASRDELEEVLLFLAVYAGFNKVTGCFGVLNEIAPASTGIESGTTVMTGRGKTYNAVLDDDELKVGLQTINPKYGDFVLRVAGEAWGRPLVDQKTKALLAMTTDVVNQSISSPNNPFVYHVNMAMKLGVSRDEVEEVLLFLAVYAGFNKVVGCFGVLNEIAPPAA